MTDILCRCNIKLQYLVQGEISLEIKTFYITKKIVNIKLGDISVKKRIRNENFYNDDISVLAASIKKNGLIEPVYLRKDINNPKKYILVDGLRRLNAFEFLGAKTIPAIILSLTDAEADMAFLYDNENRKNISIFEKAIYIGEILKSGRITKNELSDALGINIKNLEKKLKILNLTEDEREIIINHNFDEEFIEMFLDFEEEKREENLNKIIVKSLTNNEAKKYLEEMKKPEVKPIKTAHMTDDKIILNSIERMAGHLSDSGIKASCRRNDTKERTEYILAIEKPV